jgi:hypothetical protein
MKKKTYVVSTYNNYEWIRTKEAYCKLQLMIEYHREGYRVWDYPIWLAKLVYKLFRKPILKGRSATFELLIPGSDQITHASPWDGCY